MKAEVMLDGERRPEVTLERKRRQGKAEVSLMRREDRGSDAGEWRRDRKSR